MSAFSGQVPVCLRCGARDIRPQATGDGLWPGGGEGVAWVCDVCHHIGAPLLCAPGTVDDSERDGWVTQEGEEAVFALDEEAWSGRQEATAGRRAAGALMVGLGALFVVPALLALEVSLLSGDPVVVLRSLLPVAWFSAVGAALLAVGVRMFRGSPAAPG